VIAVARQRREERVDRVHVLNVGRDAPGREVFANVLGDGVGLSGSACVTIRVMLK
jgi:hypothetical protein